MKQFTILFIAAFGFLALKAQSTRRLENQKDAWGLTYIYTQLHGYVEVYFQIVRR